MTNFPLMLMAACLLMTSEPGSCQTHHSVTCEGSWAYLYCGYGSEISIIWANYGRRNGHTCSSGQPFFLLLNTACSGPTDIVEDRCDGKRCCAIKASNWEFGDTCWGTHKYLEVVYTCNALRRRSNEIYSVTCEGSVAHLRCGYGYVLNIHRADYGRHDRHTCTSTRPSYQTQYTCCSQPTGKVARRCDGRRTCTITASNWEFGDTCFGTYKYLEVTYTCDAV